MGKAQYIDPNGVRRNGHLIIMQALDTQPDGKRLLLAGKELQTFHVEEGDEFFTAVFAVDPFDDEDVVSEPVLGDVEVARRRVANYLRMHGRMGGMDHERLHAVNDVPLLASDLWTLLRALGGDEDGGV